MGTQEQNQPRSAEDYDLIEALLERIAERIVDVPCPAEQIAQRTWAESFCHGDEGVA